MRKIIPSDFGDWKGSNDMFPDYGEDMYEKILNIKHVSIDDEGKWIKDEPSKEEIRAATKRAVEKYGEALEDGSVTTPSSTTPQSSHRGRRRYEEA